MSRKRLTWNEMSRRAAAPPATPGYDDAGYRHPANQSADPEMHDYENGDTSSWAEDVDPPPYPNSPHPATPTEAGGYNHPAGNPANLKQALYRKAHKCIRIAQAMLGPKASVAQIERQALSMLDWPSRKVQSSLQRIASQKSRRACGEMGMYGMDDMYEDDLYMDPMDDMDEDDFGGGVSDMDEDDMMFGMDEDFGMDDMDEDFGMDDMDEDDGMFDEDEDEMFGNYDQMGSRFASKEDRMLAKMLREEQTKKAARSRRSASANGLGRTEQRMMVEMLRQAAEEEEGEEEGEEDAAEEEEGAKKKAFAGLSRTERHMLAKMLLASDDEDEDDVDGDSDPDPEEKEEGASKKKARVRKLRQLLASDDEDEDDVDGDSDPEEEEDEDEEGASKKASDLDPMGFMDDPMDRLASAGEDAELRALFENDLFAAARLASDDSDEDDEEGVDNEDEDDDAEEGAKAKKASRTAATQRPRARKPARQGSPQRLGNINRVASASATFELSQLWATAPDVSDAFGVSPTKLDD